MILNPFSILTAKIFGGVALAALAGLAVQTVRIEGALCRDLAAGEKPACVIQGFRQQLAVVRIDLTAARARTETEIARHQATKRAYADAQAEAARMEAERLARVIAHQKEITDAVSSDYRRELAAARARFERLRAQAAAGRTGAGGAAYPVRVPLAGGSAAGADTPAESAGFPDDRRLIATEQALQLDALIDWIAQQLRAH